MPEPAPPIPDLPLHLLEVRACLDYVKVASPVRLTAVFPRTRRFRWTSEDRGSAPTHLLTVHDPTSQELHRVFMELHNPPLFEFELSVDFWPATGTPSAARKDLLKLTFRALSARFRPDDELKFGAGMKAAHTSKGSGRPFHERLPAPNEHLIYGHRGEGHNAKLYFKQGDDGEALPIESQRVRLETRVRGNGCLELGFQRLGDLADRGLRRHLCKVFRIVDRPEVRRRSRFSAERIAELEDQMETAWRRAGVNAFSPGPLPTDASAIARSAARFREDRLLSLALYRLRRHTDAHEAIGQAIRRLERQLRATFAVKTARSASASML